MTGKKNRLLQLPQGTESLYLEEAYRHQQAVARLHNLFTSWGYLPVETPLFDFFDIYQDMISGREKDIYRLIDREGDLLMLRSDITLFLAKQIGLLSGSTDLPLRVYYSGAILRHQNQEDISKNEFFQTGVELIGKEGKYADMEVLTLLIATFKALDLSPRIHLGSRDILAKLFADFSGEEFSHVISLSGNRNFGELEHFINGRISADKKSFILDLISFIGTATDFENLLKKSAYKPDMQEQEAINHLLSLWAMLTELNLENHFRIDMSETGSQHYYTGIVFQGYLEGVDSAVVSGGRYDTLLKEFGFDSPSIGFSILLRKVEKMMSSDFSIPDHTALEQQDFTSAYREADKLRQQGRIVLL